VSDHPADQIKSTTARSNLPWSKKTDKELEQQIIDLSIDEDLKDDDVTSSYREMRACKQVNLGGRDLNEEVISMTEGSLGEQTDERVEEWKDQAESEQLTMASAHDVRQYLMMLALDPILLDREIRAQIEASSTQFFMRVIDYYTEGRRQDLLPEMSPISQERQDASLVLFDFETQGAHVSIGV
jgi:hypothetical protein